MEMRAIHFVILFSIVLLFINPVKVYTQISIPLFMGIQPNITIEKIYSKGELDINVTPFVLQLPLGEKLDFRFTTTSNYHFGGQVQEISDLGFHVVFQFKYDKDMIILGHEKIV